MIRAFQWDLARQVERLDWLLAQLPRYAEWGYEELHLHLEDAVDYPSLPGVARADAYTWSEFEQLVGAANQLGIRIVPIANLLGHTQYLIKTETWRDLNERRAPDGRPLPHGQISPSHPRTLDVAEKLIQDLKPHCTAGKIHVGLDESFHLGQHPTARAEIARIGLAAYFANYVGQLHQLAAEQGLRTGIWADMLILLPAAIPLLPPGLIAHDWYYHGFRRHPRFELYNFAEYDLTPACRARGIEYWACPMNGAFRHEPLPLFGDRLANAVAWWERAHRVNAGGFLVTSWEAGHLTPELTTVIDAAIAGLWLEGDSSDHATLLTRGLARVYGPTGAAHHARLLMACDEHPFAGYARAERNQYWDTAWGLEGGARANAETRFFERATKRKTPAPIQLSMRWRHYLAARESFVKTCVQRVMRARRLWNRAKVRELAVLIEEWVDLSAAFAETLEAGESAARDLWKLTRNPDQNNPNQAIIRADRGRWRDWLGWLKRVQRSPQLLFTASPVLGSWQLRMVVHALHPNANLVVVQQQDGHGDWQDLRQRHTIEFRSVAARRRSQIKRAWSVPIADPHRPLRIALRGLGEVAISEVELTDGITPRPNRAWRRGIQKRLGKTAPTQGWPDLDWTTNRDTLELSFAEHG